MQHLFANVTITINLFPWRTLLQFTTTYPIFLNWYNKNFCEHIWRNIFSIFSSKKKKRKIVEENITKVNHHYLPEKLVVTKEHLSSTGEWLVELPESTSQTSTSVSAWVKKNIEIIQHLYSTTLYSISLKRW